MRSNLIFKAIIHESNRYQLCRILAQGTRKLHRPYTRLQDTTNDVLQRFNGPGVVAEEEVIDAGSASVEQRRAA